MPEPTPEPMSAARQRFLKAVETRLPLPADERRETLEEISAHLDDARDELMALGSSAAEAERRAQARLGSPSALAGDLARARQTPRRTLEAVGVGAWTGVRDGLGGLILGFFGVFAAGFALAAVVQFGGQLTGTGWRLEFSDQGWNSLLVALAALVAAFQGGRGMTPAVSLAGRRQMADVQPWVLGIGTAVVAGFALFVVQMPQNWPSVLAWTVVPGGFAAGVRRPGLLPTWTGRGVTVALGALLLTTLSIGLLLSVGGSKGGVASGGGPVSVPGPIERGYELVGPQWPGNDEYSASGGTLDGARSASFTVGAGVGRLRDLRLEAWRFTDPGPAMRIAPDATQPFASAPARLVDGTLTGSIRVDAWPGFTLYGLFATGVGPDGVRYRITSSCCDQATFHGSVWDWMVAVAG